ncbi:hypothetical protein pdam_00014390 [Pocillopora damicornis]|uniref:Uncharacterized protein n=1 Tax=Pocillopora damicornis TaxID=46731 RepID=A0A3M6UFA8_POCDA|nr:hypothetical protein pdam_00014390 [Pocillopora damicornis]
MKYNHQGGKWARVPGYDSFSKEIVLTPFGKPYPVVAGQQLHLWYGEDLQNYTEGDNGGRAGVDKLTSGDDVEQNDKLLDVRLACNS